ncbi:MAG: hypothetical protein ACR2JF_17290 [Iamia sp.]
MTDAIDDILDGLDLDLDLDDLTPSSTNLPADFWSARSELDHIRQAAHARARSSDALLGVVLARVAAATPPTVRLPAIVGAPGSLNVAVAIVGAPGIGKSSIVETGAGLVALDDPAVGDSVPIGSGEGLIDAYLGPPVDEVDGVTGDKRRIRRQVRQGMLAVLDEGQALAELSSRKGSTLMPTLRTAWTSGVLGQANAAEDRRRRLGAHSYRLAVLIGLQPEHAAALLDDAAGGTPQRFLWLSGIDGSIPDDAPGWPGPLPWTPPAPTAHGATPVAHELAVPPEVAAGIRAANVARTRGEAVVDTLDAHRDLSRLKVAGLLAVLAGRTRMTVEDWELGGQVLDTSDAVRAQLLDRARQQARAREDAGHRSAVRRERAIDAGRADEAIDRMAATVARHVHRARCDGGCRRRCVTQACRSTDKKVATVDEALDRATVEGWVEVDGDTIRPGSSRPA